MNPIDISCDHIGIYLTAFMDGELEGTDADMVRGHLAECVACTRLHKEVLTLQSGARHWHIEESDTDFLPSVPSQSQEIEALRNEMQQLQSEMGVLRTEMRNVRRQILAQKGIIASPVLPACPILMPFARADEPGLPLR